MYPFYPTLHIIEWNSLVRYVPALSLYPDLTEAAMFEHVTRQLQHQRRIATERVFGYDPCIHASLIRIARKMKLHIA